MAKRENEAVDIVFHQRKQEKKAMKKQRRNKKIKKFLTVLTILALGYFYWATDISRPKAITVSGNQLLTREEILKSADININDMLIFSNPLKINRKLKKNALIESSSTQWLPLSRLINIQVSEKPVFGYRYVDKKPKLIFMDGSMIDFNDEIYHILPDLIYVEDFEDDLQKRLVDSFQDLDITVRNQIAEIHQHQVSFDDNMLKLRMNDGNQVFTSFQTVDSLNYYFDILENLKINNSCIYIDEMSGKAFSQECPQ